jgi:hypothetical protein
MDVCYTKSVIFQPYLGENKMHFNELMFNFVLDQPAKIKFNFS